MASREDSGTTLWPPKAERSITDDKGGHKHVRKRLWSSILLVAVSAFILLLVVTPTVVFVIRKIDSDVQLRSRCWDIKKDEPQQATLGQTCTSEESLKLTASVCGDLLSQYWTFDPTQTRNLNDSNSDDIDKRVISPAETTKCSLKTTEEELNLLFGYKSLFSSDCWAELPLVLCRYLFTPCSGTRPIVLWDSVTSEECMFLKKHKCQVEFLAIEQVLKSFGTCLALPDCNTMPKAESDPTHPTEVENVTSSQRRTSNTTRPGTSTEEESKGTTSITGYDYTQASTSQATETVTKSPTADPFAGLPYDFCIAPFTRGPDLNNFLCKAPCPLEDIIWETSFVRAFKATAYISLVLEYLCCFIIFYTWARERFRFPHTATFIMAVLNFFRVVMLSLPFFVGRGKLMCSLEDDFLGNLLHEATTFCIIQGGVIHFTVSTIICLFCFSIFNVLVAILTFSTDSWFKRHPMATFVIELIFASIISGSLVGGAHAGCSYATEPFLVYWCAPQGHDNIFYTFMLPLQIVIIVGMIMMFFIIRRLRQSSALRSSLSTANDKTNAAQLALSYRFMVLVIMMSLSFLIMFIILAAYQTFHDNKLDDDVGALLGCKQELLHGLRESCRTKTRLQGLFGVIIFQPIYFATFSVLLVVYSTVPAPARALWAKHMNQVRKIIQRTDPRK